MYPGWTNLFGKCNVPLLPPGQSYTAAALSQDHSVALRSDGTCVAFGSNANGECALTPLPPGVIVTAVAATTALTMLALSDGRIVLAGQPGPLWTPPTAPAGQHFRKISCSPDLGAALTNQGNIQVWGGIQPNWIPLTPAPAGSTFVDVSVFFRHGIARLSDGSATSFGDPWYVTPLPPIGEGESYLQVVPGYANVARVGPKATFVKIASGCAGTRRAAEIVPEDTPTVGGRLTARIQDLPQDVCVATLGFSGTSPSPITMASIGAPGCNWFVSADATRMLVGTGGSARLDVAIPDSGTVRGLRIFMQVLVPDALANALGAVVSDAAAAQVGG